MKRKALFFDIDGTLLEERTERFPESAKEAIARARQEGHLCFVNTGRVRCMIRYLMPRLGMDGYILGCGSQILFGEQILYEEHISIERGNAIRASLGAYGLDVCLESPDRLYLNPGPYRPGSVAWQIEQELRSRCTLSYDVYTGQDLVFDKLFLIPLSPEKEKLKQSFIQELHDFDVIDRGQGFYECVPLAYSKGKALRRVLDHFGISKEDAYVFGDSMNDLSMFQSGVSHRIIMGEHDELLRPYATFVTKPVMEDGIFFAMKELEIIP